MLLLLVTVIVSRSNSIHALSSVTDCFEVAYKIRIHVAPRTTFSGSRRQQTAYGAPMLFAAPSAYVALLTLQAGGQIQIAACDPFVDAIATPVLIIEVRITQCAWANSFFALAREVQEQLEDVDEVQVER
jgi:hypothetical protein